MKFGYKPEENISNENLGQLPIIKPGRTIIISLDEYKELLETKGRYQEIKEYIGNKERKKQ